MVAPAIYGLIISSGVMALAGPSVSRSVTVFVYVAEH